MCSWGMRRRKGSLVLLRRQQGGSCARENEKISKFLRGARARGLRFPIASTLVHKEKHGRSCARCS